MSTDWLWSLATSLGVWEHPTQGRLTATRDGDSVRVSHNGDVLRLRLCQWQSYFDGMRKGEGGWRRATVSAKTLRSACTPTI